LGTNTTNSVERYFSNRTFITLASGGFHLTHYVPGLETMFENRKHLVWYNTEEECFLLIDYYLRRPALRRKIAREGRDWVRRRYGMRRQVSRMLRLIETHYEK
jgi:spore maturation protein CgeB